MNHESRPKFPLYEPRRGEPDSRRPSGSGFWVLIFLIAACALGLASIAAIGSGLLTLGWQAVAFLQTGTWVPLTLIDAGLYAFDSSWLRYPTDWHGLHAILGMIPASAGLVVTGALGLSISFSAMDI